MLGNLNSNQNSPNKIENSILVQSLTENEEKEIPINDTPKKMKKRISPKKQATPTAGKYSRGTSSKRLRTIESFLIAPKAKRVKSTDLEDSPKKSQTIKSKGKEKDNDTIIIIDENDNKSGMQNNLVVLIDNSKKKDIIDNIESDNIDNNLNENEKAAFSDNKKEIENEVIIVNNENDKKEDNIVAIDNVKNNAVVEIVNDENKNKIEEINSNNEGEKQKSFNDEKVEEKEEEIEIDSDSSVETLSSFTSSDLDIDSDVEARLNSQSTEVSVDSDDEKDNDKKSKSSTKTEMKKDEIIEKKEDVKKAKKNKSSKKENDNNKNNEKDSSKDNKKEIKKGNKKNDKKDLINTEENKDIQNKKEVEGSNKPIQTNTKNKNRMNVDDIPDNEIVELKNKRVYFHEKKIQIETLSETLIELLCFHEYKNSQTEPISKIPERFYSLIAKLVQDSEATENNIVNSVYQSLSPTDEDEEDEALLMKSAVLPAIRNVAERKNYGIEKEGSYYPNLAIFRWEVKNLEWLPKNTQEKIKYRRKIREKASEILKKIVDNMTDDEKNNLFRSKKRKSILVDNNKSNDTNKETNDNNNNEQKSTNNTKTDEKEKNDNKNEKTEKPESAPKENEKRKIDQLQGQRSIAGFFSPIKKKKVEEKVIPETIQDKQNMEFDNRFKSFYIKSNTKLAPLNYFNDIKVEYNFDDDAMDCDEDVSLDHYLSIIRERKIQNIIKKRKEEKQKLIDSDIVDLTDGDVLPNYKMKLLQFFENHRPAYYGTWRKNTKIISGRHPFKKDTELLDYEFDSEIEWVADEEGEECLSDEEDDEEDIMDNQDEQGEDDGWLVPHGYLSDDEGVEEDIEKVNKMDKKNDPKPTKIVPLIPVIIGPVYAENSYDEIPQDNNLAQYTVQLLDEDMEFPLDPFKEYPTNDDSNSNINSNDDTEKKLKITPFPEEHLSIFVKIVQYSLKGMVKIIDETKEIEEFKNIPKIQIEKKLREIAVKEKPEGASKICWCIKDEIYQKLNIAKPDIPESLKIENSVTSPKKNKSIFKTVKSPSNNDKKKQIPKLNFLPKKKNVTSNNDSSSLNKTDNTIIIDLENDNNTI